MKNRKKIYPVLAALWATALLLAPFAGAKCPAPRMHACPHCPAARLVDSGETWVVEETTRLCELTIAEGATVTAPEGYSLTLTVNGVETGGVLIDTYGVDTEIAPSTYRGHVVLTVTEENIVSYQPAGPEDTPTVDFPFRQALYLDEDGAVAEKSVLAAVLGNRWHPNSIRKLLIRSDGENFNGIIVTGDSEYTLRQTKIHFTGNGGNDFAGYGAAISYTGNAHVVIDKARIITDGVIRGGVFVGEDSILEVNNSYIHTGSPPLPDVITGMMSVPWPLGLTGTCRSTIVVGRGTAFYNNSHIVAEGWGALSTDAAQDVALYANNCLIETIDSGYGAYADGESYDEFSGCTFNVADMALILTQGEARFTDGCVVNSDRFGVMQHSGRGADDPEILTIEKGCVFNTEEAVMMIKSSAPIINVDDSQLNSQNGVILHVMVSDDPGSGTNGGTVYANFSNMSLDGDIINSMRG